jgi:2-polyprenyl-3-methyl-5-hydroxy-6-metoxy-1,4-benzoquinol methylase
MRAMMTSDEQEHWTHIYEDKAPTELSWYQASPEPSLRALRRFGALPSSSLIDVGGGASNLVDALLEQGWQDITVLDIAAPALEAARARLGSLADKVQWEVADITDWHPARTFDVWHDRAVFHFLTEPPQREANARGHSSFCWQRRDDTRPWPSPFRMNGNMSSASSAEAIRNLS